MMTLIAILFWLWFLVSCVIVVRRSIRRRAEKRARRAGLQSALHEAPAGADSAEATDPGPADEADPLPETTWVADTAPVPQPAPAPPTEPAVAPPVARRATTAEPTPATAAAVAAAPEPAPSKVATMARSATPVTVAQVIAGIDMPCGLVPLTLSDHDMRYDRGQRAQFFTTDIPAAVVGTSLADELERIGLTVSSLNDSVAVAQRGRLAVEMRIVTVGAAIDGVASTEYRSAPPNSVVVEFDVVPA